MKLARWFLHAALGSAAVAATAPATVDAVAAPSRDIPGEAAVFARFSDLAAPETEARLGALLEGRATSDLLVRVTALLARGDASPAEFERLVAPLVVGKETTDVDTSLAAILLDLYQGHLRAGLAAKELQPADVFDALIAADQQLVAAVYGPGATYVRTRR